MRFAGQKMAETDLVLGVGLMVLHLSSLYFVLRALCSYVPFYLKTNGQLANKVQSTNYKELRPKTQVQRPKTSRFPNLLWQVLLVKLLAYFHGTHRQISHV